MKFNFLFLVFSLCSLVTFANKKDIAAAVQEETEPTVKESVIEARKNIPSNTDGSSDLDIRNADIIRDNMKKTESVTQNTISNQGCRYENGKFIWPNLELNISIKIMTSVISEVVSKNSIAYTSMVSPVFAPGVVLPGEENDISFFAKGSSISVGLTKTIDNIKIGSSLTLDAGAQSGMDRTVYNIHNLRAKELSGYLESKKFGVVIGYGSSTFSGGEYLATIQDPTFLQPGFCAVRQTKIQFKFFTNIMEKINTMFILAFESAYSDLQYTLDKETVILYKDLTFLPQDKLKNIFTSLENAKHTINDKLDSIRKVSGEPSDKFDLVLSFSMKHPSGFSNSWRLVFRQLNIGDCPTDMATADNETKKEVSTNVKSTIGFALSYGAARRFDRLNIVLDSGFSNGGGRYVGEYKQLAGVVMLADSGDKADVKIEKISTVFVRCGLDFVLNKTYEVTLHQMVGISKTVGSKNIIELNSFYINNALKTKENIETMMRMYTMPNFIIGQNIAYGVSFSVQPIKKHLHMSLCYVFAVASFIKHEEYEKCMKAYDNKFGGKPTCHRITLNFVINPNT